MNLSGKKIVFVSVLILIFSFSIFSQIINPVEGVWANKQSLVIDLEEGDSAFYSFNGENPEVQGFAYDGPVFLDVDGSVFLKIVIIRKNGNKIIKNLNYTVNDVSLPDDEKASSFLSKIKNSPFYEYFAGDKIEIPENIFYSFSSLKDAENGKTISILKDSIISRFLPCNFIYEENVWRTVLKIQPSSQGIFTRKDVPFKISDWNNLSFSDLKLLYKIDDEYWKQMKKPVSLERTESHMISWQDVNYNPENPVNYFVLPEKPEIFVKTDERGVKNISFKEGTSEGFKFAVLQGDSFGELFDSVSIDTFEGDAFSGKLHLGIFYDSVFQALEEIDFNVFKKSPSKPEFLSSASQYISREPVKVKISAENSKEIYYHIFGPVELSSENYSKASEVLLKLSDSSFKKYVQPIILDSKTEGGSLYKISAYSIDSYGQKSLNSEYSVIIDQSNFYVNPSSDSEFSLGSYENPFKSFEECIPFINQTRYANVRISGEVSFPEGNTVLSSNCTISGNENAKLILPENSSVTVRNSSLAFNALLIEHKGFKGKSQTDSVFSVSYGVLDFFDCEVLIPFSRNGMAIKSEKSVVNLCKTGFTVTADSYNSVCASVNSKIFVKKSKISGVAQTSVLFSVQGGSFEMTDSFGKVTCDLGRIAELFESESVLKNNVFTGELSKPLGTTKPVYVNSKNASFISENNQESGF